MLKKDKEIDNINTIYYASMEENKAQFFIKYKINEFSLSYTLLMKK